MRWRSATGCWRELAPRLLGLARRAARRRHRLYRRRRGGRPARAVARSGRGVGARPGAGRLGRARPCRPGLSEARLAGDRLARRPRPPRPPPADGASGQGRLLGQRDQARPGARARRLSGLHPQARDRRLLSRLRAPAVRRPATRSIRNSPPTTRTPSPPCSSSPASAAIGNSSACTAWARRFTT